MNTVESISKIISPALCDETTYQAFQQRLTEGLPTRDENTASHFCVYFLPFDAQKKKVFIIHHKKSGFWISPGGHIDQGETPLEALNREISEELGVENFFHEEPSPFLLTIAHIENPVQPCKTHYDIWFLVPTDGSNFNINPEEFHETKWMTFEEAENVVTESANSQALEIIKNSL